MEACQARHPVLAVFFSEAEIVSATVGNTVFKAAPTFDKRPSIVKVTSAKTPVAHLPMLIRDLTTFLFRRLTEEELAPFALRVMSARAVSPFPSPFFLLLGALTP